jgi:hypothetical protein
LKSVVRVLIWIMRVPAFACALVLFVGTVCFVGGTILGREAFSLLASDRSPTKFVSKLWSG